MATAHAVPVAQTIRMPSIKLGKRATVVIVAIAVAIVLAIVIALALRRR
jgi:hypothetical protein